MIKKLCKFILMLLISPLFIPMWVISLTFILGIEFLSDNPNYKGWWEYHYAGIKPLLFR